MSGTRTQHKGFTLVEVLVVIAITLILLVVSIEGFNSFATRPATETGARTVLAALETAHARTMSADNATHYGVHFATYNVTVFPGDTYVSGGSDNLVYTLKRAQISNIALTGSTTDVIFARLRGTPSATGTVTVINSADPSQTLTVVIFGSGLSEVQ